MIIELSKGYQITIPAHIRRRYELEPGAKLELEETDGEIVLKPLQDSWDNLFADAKKLPAHDKTPEELDDLTRLY